MIVKDGCIVGEAHNEVLVSKDPMAHAELLAIRRASATLQTFDLSGCELYTNGAPCCMYMASMLWARINRCHYVLPLEASAVVGLSDAPFYEELALPLEARRIVPMVQRAARSEEAMAVYLRWRDQPGKVQF